MKSILLRRKIRRFHLMKESFFFSECFVKQVFSILYSKKAKI